MSFVCDQSLSLTSPKANYSPYLNKISTVYLQVIFIFYLLHVPPLRWKELMHMPPG